MAGERGEAGGNEEWLDGAGQGNKGT